MAKKLSVEEVLAAARAEKAKGAAPPPAAEKAPAASSKPAKEPAAEEAPAPPVPAAAPAGKVAPGGKGMSMADILAAARAGKGDGAKPAVDEKPAKAAVSEKPAAAVAEKPATAKPAAKPAPKADGNAAAAPKDTASILAAARKGAKPGPMTKAEAAAKAAPAAPVAKKKLEVPPMPARPDYARPPSPTAAADAIAATRRGFLAATAGLLFGSSLAVGFTSLAVTHLIWLLGFARFMFPNILIEPPTRFKVGFPDSLAPGQVETKYIPQFGVWVVRYEFDGQPMIFALKSVCTHLGCTPNWLEAEQKFKCPCHGSGFYKDGVNFEGPAPRPLERYAVSLADDGQLLVDKSRTFQQELGQWKDASSFVNV
jgi:cytochrome b6-f complex iron-sulfur subunit